MRSRRPEALAGIRVLELAQGVAGPLCARYLADYGAEVAKIEPPSGDPTRAWNPRSLQSLDLSGWFVNLNRNKRGIVLDLQADSDRQVLDRLVKNWADVVVVDETFLSQPGCTPDHLLASNPRLVVVALSPFGVTGPYAGAPGTDLTALAAGGILWLTGDPDREPVQLPGQQALSLSGVVAAAHALLAIAVTEAGGPGQIVDVSYQEVVALSLEQATAECAYLGNVVRRNGVRHLVAHGMGRPRLADGSYVFAGNLPEPRMWDAVVDFLGLDELRGEELRDLRRRTPHADRIDTVVQQAIANLTLDEVFGPLQERGVPVTPISDAQAVLESDQLRAREFFVPVEHRPGNTITLLGPAVRLTETPGRIKRPAPELDEDGPEIRRVSAECERRSQSRQPVNLKVRRALKGIRVLDLTWVWSGPMLTQILAAHGADVVKIESGLRPDLGRTIGPWTGERDLDGSGFFHLYNRGKRSVAINLRSPEGVGIIRDLAAVSDIVIENFSAGKMNDFGLGFATLAERNRALVMVSLPGAGATGPQRRLLLYGQNVESMAGMMHTTGYPDRGPLKAGVIYCDPVAGFTGTFAALAALRIARRTGIGQHVDCSMIEAAVSLMTESMMLYSMRREVAGRNGNRSNIYAPHGVYACRGADRWVALAVADGPQWQALCSAIDRPELAGHYPTFPSRLAARDDIDAAVARWCLDRDRDEVVDRLRAAGIAVAAVQDPADLFHDPHLAARGFFLRSEEPVVGIQPLPGLVPLSATPGSLTRPSPMVGQHTRSVLHDLLGWSEGALDRLESQGVLR